jgi:hypothetical protein
VLVLSANGFAGLSRTNRRPDGLPPRARGYQRFLVSLLGRADCRDCATALTTGDPHHHHLCSLLYPLSQLTTLPQPVIWHANSNIACSHSSRSHSDVATSRIGRCNSPMSLAHTLTETLIMPPRAASRRVGRPRRGEEAPVEVSPVTDDVHSPLPRLQKPHLPKLKGTPSSRRQYAYGAEEEPLPARAGSRMRNDEELDLGNAVGNLLERQEEEDTRERMPPPPPPIEPHEQEDELAAAPQPPAGRRTQGERPRYK